MLRKNENCCFIGTEKHPEIPPVQVLPYKEFLIISSDGIFLVDFVNSVGRPSSVFLREWIFSYLKKKKKN